MKTVAFETEALELINEMKLCFQARSENVDSHFYLASAYEAQGNMDKAKEMYTKIVEKFPGTARANQAQRALNNM